MAPEVEHKDIDARLAQEVGSRLSRFHAHVKEVPQYRFVDIHRAAEWHSRSLGVTAIIESDHRNEYLSAILGAKPDRWTSRRISRSERIGWPVGPGDEVFLPVDVFWVCAAGSKIGRGPPSFACTTTPSSSGPSLRLLLLMRRPPSGP